MLFCIKRLYRVVGRRKIYMTDSQKLDIILSKINQIDDIKIEIAEVRTTLKEEIAEVRTTLKEEIDELRNDVKDIKLIIENEIRPNIQRVAEGHLDLSRNLHEVMKYKDEIEMLSINTKMLESEVQGLKKIS